MDEHTFRTQLIDEGFSQIVAVEREANGSVADHAHPFEAKALIMRGEIRIRTDGSDASFKAGDMFHLKAGQDHEEFYGPEGVAYLVGRK